MSSTANGTTKKPKVKRPSFVALCGRVFHADSEFFPQTEYRGRTIFLCTNVCLDAFLSDPDRFVAAHKKSYKKPTEVITS